MMVFRARTEGGDQQAGALAECGWSLMRGKADSGFALNSRAGDVRLDRRQCGDNSLSPSRDLQVCFEAVWKVAQALWFSV
jgi:hypothetical protein